MWPRQHPLSEGPVEPPTHPLPCVGMHETLLTAPSGPHLILQVPENYFCVPDLGQVPEIDVPSYLPDLPGIADDLMYSADLGPGIAPPPLAPFQSCPPSTQRWLRLSSQVSGEQELGRNSLT